MFGVPHSVQVFLFLKSVGLGFATGGVYLPLRLLRRLVPHRSAAVFFEDVLFCGFAALLLFYFLFTYNAGVPRAYLLAGDALGFFLCYAFLRSFS